MHLSTRIVSGVVVAMALAGVLNAGRQAEKPGAQVPGQEMTGASVEQTAPGNFVARGLMLLRPACDQDVTTPVERMRQRWLPPHA